MLNLKDIYCFMIIVIPYNSTFRTHTLFNLKDLRFGFLTHSKTIWSIEQSLEFIPVDLY